MEIDGKTIVLTGATSGIGRAAARMLAARVGVLIIQGPENEATVSGLLRELRAMTARVEYVGADFSTLDAVRRAAGRIRQLVPSIDVLINNAGVPGARSRIVTRDGFERTLQVNFLAPALLTDLLVPAMADGGRIVDVSSTTHRMTSLNLDDLDLEHAYEPVRAYAQSKLAIVTYATWSAGMLPRGIDVVSISPGVISTDLLHSMFGTGGARVDHGGRRVVEAVMANVPTGSYIDDGQLVRASDDALDESTQGKLAAVVRRRISRIDSGAVPLPSA
jgi:NAD(P)-dependent dehydrogenase (short-subunit alcohol dehydrogenase family)